MSNIIPSDSPRFVVLLCKAQLALFPGAGIGVAQPHHYDSVAGHRHRARGKRLPSLTLPIEAAPAPVAPLAAPPAPPASHSALPPALHALADHLVPLLDAGDRFQDGSSSFLRDLVNRHLLSPEQTRTGGAKWAAALHAALEPYGFGQNGGILRLALARRAELAAPQPSPAEDYELHGTRCAAFLSWFGNWVNAPESASKVVDPATGEPQFTYPVASSHVVGPDAAPKVVYHGTGAGHFNAFDPQHMNPDSLYGPGFYFTEDQSIAEGTTFEQDKFTYHRTKREAEAVPGRVGSVRLEDSGGRTGVWVAHSRENLVQKTGYRHKGIALEGAEKDEFFRRIEAEFKRLQHSATADRIKPDKIEQGARYLAKYRTQPKVELSEAVNNFNFVMPGVDVKQIGHDMGLWDKGHVFAVYLNIRNPIAVDEPLTGEQAERLADAIERLYEVRAFQSGRRATDVLREVGRRNDYLRRAKAQPGNQIYGQVFNVEMALSDISNGVTTERIPASDQLPRGATKGLRKSNYRELFMAAGFDGMTHLGGGIVGDKEHRVWIAFLPNQVKAVDNDGGFSATDNDIHKGLFDGAPDTPVRGQPSKLKGKHRVGGQGPQHQGSHWQIDGVPVAPVVAMPDVARPGMLPVPHQLPSPFGAPRPTPKPPPQSATPKPVPAQASPAAPAPGKSFATVPQFTTHKEAESWCHAQYPDVTFAFKGLHPAVVQAIAEQWHFLAQRYPVVAAGVRFIGNGKSPAFKAVTGQQFPTRKALAAASQSAIGFNANEMGKPDVEQVRAESYKCGWAATKDLAGLITHEFGHVVTHSLAAQGGRVSKALDAWLTKPAVNRSLSAYATTHPSEAFAEGFAALHCGSLEKRQHDYVQLLGEFLEVAASLKSTAKDKSETAAQQRKQSQRRLRDCMARYEQMSEARIGELWNATAPAKAAPVKKEGINPDTGVFYGYGGDE